MYCDYQFLLNLLMIRREMNAKKKCWKKSVRWKRNETSKKERTATCKRVVISCLFCASFYVLVHSLDVRVNARFLFHFFRKWVHLISILFWCRRQSVCANKCSANRFPSECNRARSFVRAKRRERQRWWFKRQFFLCSTGRHTRYH